jgi:hypothetical protein
MLVTRSGLTLAGVGSHLVRAGANYHYRDRITDADLADESGDGAMFPYQRLPDNTWGPTTAIDYPIGREGFSTALGGVVPPGVDAKYNRQNYAH